MAAEYEVNIKLNSKEIETQLGNIDKVVSRIGKPKGGGSRKKAGIAGLLPSSEDLKAAEKGIVQLTAKTKAIQSIQDKFSERRIRALTRSNTLNEKELRINKQLTAEARSRLRLLSQAGAKGFEAGRPQGRQLANDINARAKAQEKRAKLANKINQMEARGLNVAKLRKQLGKATTEQAAGRFAGAQKEFRLLQKTIELENSKLRILREQTTQKRFAASPIRGTATMMGSPAQIAASGRQLASPIRGGVGFPGSPKALEEAAKGVAALQKAGMDLMRLAGTAGRLAGRTARVIDSSNLRQRNAATLPSSEILQARARKTGQDIVQLKTKEAALQERIAQALERSAQRSADVRRETERTVPALKGARAAMPFDDSFGPQLPSRTSAPLTGMTGGFGGSRFGAFGKAAKKRVGDVALGAGFPLLFGGGPGAVIGGALGGAAGGGLAGQIALSAIGQQIDALVQRIGVVGSAFNELTLDIGTVATATGVANTEIQSQLEKIEQYGSAAQAAQLATELLASRVGGKGRDALQKFGEDAVTLGNNLNVIFTQLLSNIAKIAGPILEQISRFAANIGARGAFDRAEGLTGAAAVVQKFRQSRQTITDVKSLRRGLTEAGFTGELPAQSTRSARKFAKSFAERTGSDILEVPELKIAEIAGTIQTPDEISAVNKAAEEQKRLEKRLTRLDAERQKVLDISSLKDKIAVAEQAGDKSTVIRLNGQQKLKDIEARRLKDLAGVEKQSEKIAINDLAAARSLAAQADTARELNQLAFERQAAFENKLTSAENEGRLLQAQLDGRLEEEQLLINIEQLTKDMSAPRAAQLETQLQQNAALKKQVELSEKLDKVYEQIESTLATGLSSALQSVINKTESLGDAVKGVLADIGNMLLRLGIETAVKVGFSALTSGGGGSGGTTLDIAGIQSYMADGGYVGGPTRALIGEGGQGEYVIPESKMRESMARYSRGARGSSVIPESGESGTVGGDGGGTAIAAPIDVRYTVERINDVEYVTAAQFQAGMQQAAAQGAQRGEQQTLRRLQMSGSTRRRIGL
ncbi:phage tail tape measure protein [uncultured Mediterranean phage MEDS2 group]|nr:phage tail tape measure protein [uncultured Mediterranean phage MEDS2 group]